MPTNGSIADYLRLTFAEKVENIVIFSIRTVAHFEDADYDSFVTSLDSSHHNILYIASESLFTSNRLKSSLASWKFKTYSGGKQSKRGSVLTAFSK